MIPVPSKRLNDWKRDIKGHRPTSTWLVWVGVGIGGAVAIRYLVLFAISNQAARNQELAFVWVAPVVFIAAVSGLSLAAWHNAARARLLAFRHPDSTVLNARMTSSARRFFIADTVDDDPRPIPLFGFSLLADREGLEFWTGGLILHQIAVLGWSQVDEVAGGQIRSPRTTPDSIVVRTARPGPTLSFPVAATEGLGLALIRGAALRELVRTVQAQRHSDRPSTLQERRDTTRGPLE